MAKSQSHNRPRASSLQQLDKRRIETVHSQGLWKDILNMQWMRVPSSSFTLLTIPFVLYFNWHFLASGHPNPFEPFIFITHKIPGTSPNNPLYQKGYNDILFVLYYIIFWSFVRQVLVLHVFQPFGRWWGIRQQNKLDRVGEQGYALVYFGLSGAWGLKIMQELPTWYYNTEGFWIDYPHWRMPAQLKAFYLLQTAYWIQQLLVLVLGLEKPRKDFRELVIHHIVTLWLVCWSYLVNLTFIGNAIFVSMDIPDAVFGATKLMNYMQLERVKAVAFLIFIGVWSYFRHWLNLIIIKSVWSEFHLIPQEAQQWKPSEGIWMVWWMQYQVLVPIVLLQMVQLFWYFLIWRVFYRAVFQAKLDDERSDDEGDEELDGHDLDEKEE
ncbi:longevity assurance proteins LAG1/LAC1 [Sistotremastrum suecicum HHB10207 ss-3]|uniref:Longevity assurance proteins LAG1/LAC1 n=1 Tax=Sistotremastrum suecicum HHB10207 ss-3 TaxID=1314776 RepID=A0A166DS65_9AGAM|nr:longevity assurance proteins LAG1/LAC1 [Sistotremastrum suecicum HHB10207 ss-3]